MINTTLCYIEQEGKYLLLHRVKKKNDINKDKWIGIGGKFEEGESPEDCLLREVREETGLTLTAWRFRGVVIVDEAYSDFSSQPSLRSELAKYPNLIVLNTMSKAWGCAAIRLGMAFASEQIIAIFDAMTYNKVKVTYDAYCDMIPSLTDEEKAQLYAWLCEARDLAIDAESSNKKHEVFNKYKGRINNYLSARGYDITQERKAWEERVKARGGTL